MSTAYKMRARERRGSKALSWLPIQRNSWDALTELVEAAEAMVAVLPPTHPLRAALDNLARTLEENEG